MAVGQLARWRP